MVSLWRSEGTTESTRLVRDFIPGANQGQPEAFVASRAGLFFRASTQEAGAELWRMNRVYFTGWDPEHEWVLWVM
jgi:ELWxxDGT repeat protein